MDASKKAMDDFNSLWFFNNVLTLTTPLEHLLDEEEEEDTVGEETKPSESMILHDVLVGAEILVPRCPNCGEIAGVGVEQRRAVQPIQAAVHAKTERRKRGRRRRKRSKRKLDLGYYGSLDSESSFSEAANGLYYLEMPPLNDGSAMKEHLKSWAYAVACIVR
ncbi:hypothetical protein V6N13_015568 [Hibiscus sabdariffa]|uniref:Uncharacterized protein n=2 Tax=Hibiscus sabdariffa TaxID=183260 RepID=A0ABR2CWR8_9ROSI